MKRRATELKMAIVCIFLLLLLGMSNALPQDMSGKILVFPQQSDSAQVRLTTSRQNLGAVTVCMRYFTDLTREFSFFSLSTPSHENAFLLFKFSARDRISATIRNAESLFPEQDFQTNRWQSLCGTWDAASGLVQLWVDGKPSSMKFVSDTNINEPMIIVLGQEQDSHGGGFDINQSFEGMIADVHMWDYVLSPCQIESYSKKLTFQSGNILNWNSIEFQITGRVVIKEEQNQC